MSIIMVTDSIEILWCAQYYTPEIDIVLVDSIEGNNGPVQNLTSPQ